MTNTTSIRSKWAKAAARVVTDASRSHFPRYASPLTELGVASSCTPQLLAIAEVLRDESQPVTPAALAALKAFLTDGADSALYGRDALAARRQADHVLAAFVDRSVAERKLVAA